MILNVLTLPAARAAQSLPKRGGDVSGHRNPLRGWPHDEFLQRVGLDAF
jgi:hypothetical protein